MQKKSLLVALFCGALCLTGCIKNEESASVAQVRIAKATQLQALADFYKAQGQAEVIYAQAEATLKQAQAALIMAQAETEKVRAELLKVQVKLQEVKVDEEKIVWQKMQAELEVALAKAEAQKQFWANELNNLIAEAQASAIENAQKIMEAQADFEAYILALEGAKADSAKVYSDLYFATLKEIEKLQVEELEYKAKRTLLNQGAVIARELIYEEIDKTVDTIEFNKAVIAHLKEHQTVTPEQAQEALMEARESLTVAFNVMQQYVQLEQTANREYNSLKNKTADFAQDWSGVFTVGNFAPYVTIATKDGVKGYYELDAKGKATDNFIPLYTEPAAGKQWAKETPKTVRYPDIDVYKGEYRDFVKITTTDITPASINFDNIADAVEKATVAKEKELTLDNQVYENVVVPAAVLITEAVIEVYQDTLDLHTAYVEERGEAVALAEAAYLQAVADAKTAKETKEEAWNDFQNYMLEKYDVSRQLFINQWNAQAAYDKASADSLSADDNLKIAKTGVTTLEGEYAKAIEKEAKAEGAYKKAKDEKIPADVEAAWEAAQLKYNPKFDPTKDFKNFGEGAVYDYWNINSNKEKVIGTQAGSAQNKYAAALDTLQAKQEAQILAQEEYWRGHISGTQYKTYTDAVVEAEEAVDAQETKVSTAAKGYATAKSAYDEAASALTEAEAAWNPKYSALWEGLTDHKYKEVLHGELKVKAWVDKEGDEAGTAQAERDTAWVTLKKAEKQLVATPVPTTAEELKTATTGQKAAYYKKVAEDKLVALKGANEALIAALAPGAEGVEIEDVLDPDAKELYDAYKNAKANDKTEEKKTILVALYRGFNPDQIAELVKDPKNNIYNNPKAAQYSWLFSYYQADYTAQMIDFETNKYVPIAKFLFPGETKATWYTHSLDYQIEAAEASISDEAIAKLIKDYKDANANTLKTFKSNAQTFLKKVNAYKAHEATYNEWIVSIEEAEGVVNGLKMDTFDAREDYRKAQAYYDGLAAVANQGMWVFDPEKNFKVSEGYVRRGDFAWINLNEEIEYLENENERLEAKVTFLRNVLTDGKKVLTVINDIIDQKIQVVSDNIQILAAIAVKYRAIMDAYLGIDETTGPVDGEDEE